MRQIDKSRNYKYTQRAAHCRKMRMRSRLPHGVRRTMHTHDTLRGVTLSIFSYMKNPSRLEAR